MSFHSKMQCHLDGLQISLLNINCVDFKTFILIHFLIVGGIQNVNSLQITNFFAKLCVIISASFYRNLITKATSVTCYIKQNRHTTNFFKESVEQGVSKYIIVNILDNKDHQHTFSNMIVICTFNKIHKQALEINK